MGFYTAEANGRPFVVFQAADKGDAVHILNNPMVVMELSTRNDADGRLIWPALRRCMFARLWAKNTQNGWLPIRPRQL
jgi:hypothetical protein